MPADRMLYRAETDGTHAYVVRVEDGVPVLTCCGRPQGAPASQGPLPGQARVLATLAAEALALGQPMVGWALGGGGHPNTGGGYTLVDQEGRYVAHTSRVYQKGVLVVTEEESQATALLPLREVPDAG